MVLHKFLNGCVWCNRKQHYMDSQWVYLDLYKFIWVYAGSYEFISGGRTVGPPVTAVQVSHLLTEPLLINSASQFIWSQKGFSQRVFSANDIWEQNFKHTPKASLHRGGGQRGLAAPRAAPFVAILMEAGFRPELGILLPDVICRNKNFAQKTFCDLMNTGANALQD
jgi:hypothetical protein